MINSSSVVGWHIGTALMVDQLIARRISLISSFGRTGEAISRPPQTIRVAHVPGNGFAWLFDWTLVERCRLSFAGNGGPALQLGLIQTDQANLRARAIRKPPTVSVWANFSRQTACVSSARSFLVGNAQGPHSHSTSARTRTNCNSNVLL